MKTTIGYKIQTQIVLVPKWLLTRGVHRVTHNIMLSVYFAHNNNGIKIQNSAILSARRSYAVHHDICVTEEKEEEKT